MKESFESIKEKRKYTLEDLEKEKQWDSGFGPNNPNAFSRELRKHRERLKAIEDSLIEQGLIPKPEKQEWEKINEELDALYPNAKSRKIIKYRGQRYQIKYFPKKSSRSGKTIQEWGHTWQLLSETE